MSFLNPRPERDRTPLRHHFVHGWMLESVALGGQEQPLRRTELICLHEKGDLMTMNTLGREKPLNAFHLRMIALISMFLDHFAAILLSSLLNATLGVTNAMRAGTSIREILIVFCSRNQDVLWGLFNACRWIGRIAFPLYAFLIVQGFMHTRSRLRYAARLAILAVLSEIPFDLAFSGEILEFLTNNVFFTLLAGLLLIWGISRLETLCSKIINPLLRRGALLAGGIFLYICAGFVITSIFNSDYGLSGISAVLLIYLLRKWPAAAVMAGGIATIVLNLSLMQVFSLAAVIPVLLYNGKKGPSGKVFFYGFYPIHLLLLWLTCLLLNL